MNIHLNSAKSYSASNYFNTVLRNAKSLISNCFSIIQKIFYEQTLFFAMNNQEIKNKFHQYKDSSWTQKFKIGVIAGAKNLLLSLPIIAALNATSILIKKGLSFASIRIPNGKQATFKLSQSLFSCLSAVVAEEVLLRGILQNCLVGFQKITIYITPQCLQDNRVFKWLTSPSARIIIANTIFAGLHLSNAGRYLSTEGSIIQACCIILQPVEGILHEITGNIIAPIASHMTNNFLVLFIFKLICRS